MKIKEREKQKLKKSIKKLIKKSGVGDKGSKKTASPLLSAKKKKKTLKKSYKDEEGEYTEKRTHYIQSYSPYDDEEDSYDDVEEIMEEISEFLDYRSDLIPIEFTDGWAIIANFKVLKIYNIHNAGGFQPLDNIQEQKKCLLTIVQFGREPIRGELAYRLKKLGCPSIRISSKYDVSSKLDAF